jgi:hypothetical protein
MDFITYKYYLSVLNNDVPFQEDSLSISQIIVKNEWDIVLFLYKIGDTLDNE